ncbi:MAG: APC family permease [Thermodesulfobacteriota bacterium]
MATATVPDAPPALKRALGPAAITLYAVGDILGAGIYALVGKVADVAGTAAWLSFGVAAVLAVLTGFTYAELSSRHPVAAGAAAYCKRAFAHPAIAFLVGMLVLASGITSAATVSLAFAGYLAPFVTVPPLAGSVTLLALMTFVSYRGIEASSRVNVVLTLAEVSGLLLVLAVGAYYASGLEAGVRLERIAPDASLGAVLGGATLAFYSYIGFEDTANVAEEVRDPRRVLPRAILGAIAISCLVYVGVTLAALMTLPADVLAHSDAPLLDVLRAAGVEPPGGAFSIVALLAICNTGLLNLIMASRLTYGMANEGLLPAVLARVHPVRATPWVAVLVAFVLAVGLAGSGGVQVLAQTTSLLLLSVFAVLHVGLMRLKRSEPVADPEVFRTPAWTPVAGLVMCAALALRFPVEAYARMLGVLVVAALLYAALGHGRR